MTSYKHIKHQESVTINTIRCLDVHRFFECYIVNNILLISKSIEQCTLSICLALKSNNELPGSSSQPTFVSAFFFFRIAIIILEIFAWTRMKQVGLEKLKVQSHYRYYSKHRWTTTFKVYVYCTSVMVTDHVVQCSPLDFYTEGRHTITSF